MSQQDLFTDEHFRWANDTPKCLQPFRDWFSHHMIHPHGASTFVVQHNAESLERASYGGHTKREYESLFQVFFRANNGNVQDTKQALLRSHANARRVAKTYLRTQVLMALDEELSEVTQHRARFNQVYAMSFLDYLRQLAVDNSIPLVTEDTCTAEYWRYVYLSVSAESYYEILVKRKVFAPCTNPQVRELLKI